MEEKDYHQYVKKEFWDKFESLCQKNHDFYGAGIMETAKKIMYYLEIDKFTSATAWEKAMKNTGHSGYSASAVAITVANFSATKGEEFKQWCIDNDIVDVKWKR